MAILITLVNERRAARDLFDDSSSIAFPDCWPIDLDRPQIAQPHCRNLSHCHWPPGFDPLGLIRWSCLTRGKKRVTHGDYEAASSPPLILPAHLLVVRSPGMCIPADC